jgi:hypothetical protein
MTKKSPEKRGKHPFGAAFWPPRCPRPGGDTWDELPWPERVPVLAAKDVTRSHVVPLEGPPYNLDGWLEVTFEADLSSPAKRWIAHAFRAALEQVIEGRAGVRLSVWEYAWLDGVGPALLASAWNEMLAALGYAVDGVATRGERDGEYDKYFS